jgi:hypothetical protein
MTELHKKIHITVPIDTRVECARSMHGIYCSISNERKKVFGLVQFLCFFKKIWVDSNKILNNKLSVRKMRLDKITILKTLWCG